MTMALALAVWLAQDSEPQVSLRAATAPEGVVLRWVILGKRYPEGGFHIYRKPAGGSFERATREPVRRMTLAEIERAYGKPFADVMHGYFAEVARDQRAAQEFALAVRCDIDLRAAQSAGLYYLDERTSRGARYGYELRAVVGGREERWASCEEVEAGGAVSIPEPTDLKAAVVAEGVELSWKRVRGIYAYVVYRTSQEGGKLERLTDPAAFFALDPPDAKEPSPGRFVDAGVAVGGTVWYAVTALDIFGRESAATRRLKVEVRDAIPPPPPKGMRAEIGEGIVRLRWEAVDAPDLAGYHVYRASGDAPEKLTREPVKVVEHRDRPPAPGAFLYFARAVDTSGNESAPGAGAVVRVEDREPPPKVMRVRAAAEKGRVSLEWAGVAERDLSHYAVFRSTAAGGPWMRVGETKDTRFEDAMSEAIGGPMWYRVRAIDTSGNEGEPSETVEAMLPDTVPPAAPSLVRAVSTDKGVRLEWELLDGEEVAGVRVEWAPSEEGPWSDVSGLVREKRFITAKSGWFRVVAEDASKNRSAPSNVLWAAPVDRTPPARPEGVTAQAFEDGIRLSWRSNVEEDLEGYVVERLEEGEWRQVGEAVGQPQAVDWSARRGMPHRYRVVAFDRAGNRSEPSQVVEAKK